MREEEIELGHSLISLEEPPPVTGRGKTGLVQQGLIDVSRHKDSWCKINVPYQSASAAHQVLNALRKKEPPRSDANWEDWQIVVRKTLDPEDGKFYIWARFKHVE